MIPVEDISPSPAGGPDAQSQTRRSKVRPERAPADAFAKRIIFTDWAEWSTSKIVVAYRSQWEAEAAFRQIKNPEHASFRPIHHWTDHKVQVTERLERLLFLSPPFSVVWPSIGRETARTGRKQMTNGRVRFPRSGPEFGL
jgi:hypothetical protein